MPTVAVRRAVAGVEVMAATTQGSASVAHEPALGSPAGRPRPSIRRSKSRGGDGDDGDARCEDSGEGRGQAAAAEAAASEATRSLSTPLSAATGRPSPASAPQASPAADASAAAAVVGSEWVEYTSDEGHRECADLKRLTQRRTLRTVLIVAPVAVVVGHVVLRALLCGAGVSCVVSFSPRVPLPLSPARLSAYYYNAATGDTCWEPPPALVAQRAAAVTAQPADQPATLEQMWDHVTGAAAAKQASPNPSVRPARGRSPAAPDDNDGKGDGFDGGPRSSHGSGRRSKGRSSTGSLGSRGDASGGGDGSSNSRSKSRSMSRSKSREGAGSPPLLKASKSSEQLREALFGSDSGDDVWRRALSMKAAREAAIGAQPQSVRAGHFTVTLHPLHPSLSLYAPSHFSSSAISITISFTTLLLSSFPFFLLSPATPQRSSKLPAPRATRLSSRRPWRRSRATGSRRSGARSTPWPGLNRCSRRFRRRQRPRRTKSLRCAGCTPTLEWALSVQKAAVDATLRSPRETTLVTTTWERRRCSASAKPQPPRAVPRAVLWTAPPTAMCRRRRRASPASGPRTFHRRRCLTGPAPSAASVRSPRASPRASRWVSPRPTAP